MSRLQISRDPDNENPDTDRPSAEALRVVDSLAMSTIPFGRHAVSFATMSVYHVLFIDVRHPTLGIARRTMSSNEETVHYLGPYTSCCSKCKAFHWIGEQSVSHCRQSTYLLCCHHGKIDLPFLQDPPQPLRDLYTTNSASAKLFFQHIVQYNAALAFTSLGVNPDHAVNSQHGPPVFRVHGEVMHWSGSLLPTEDSTPSYAQLYIYDSQQALHYRMTRNPILNAPLMESLQAMMIHHNPYYRLYRHAYEVLQLRNAPDYSARLITLPGHDHRRNALPTADEVAVIVPDSIEHVVESSRDIILHLRSTGSHFPLQRISDGHAAYAPTHYVLLFPRGEAGWHWDIRQVSTDDSVVSRKVTLCQFVSFRLHARPTTVEFSTILRSRRLLHHYIVDMFACIDQSRLLFHRTHQQQYRISTASGVDDALHATDDTANSQQSLRDRLASIGQRIYLPSSYLGGPRDMYDRYQDGMAVARYFKQIDLFITMTANPNWREIREALLPHQSPSDRPDIIA